MTNPANRFLTPGLLLLALADGGSACSGSSQSSSETDTGAMAATSAGSSSSATSSSSTTASESTTNGSTGTPDLCGNGFKDAGEECDDGNAIEGDGCNGDCVSSGKMLWEHREDRGGNDQAFGVATQGATIVVAGTVGINGQGRNGWLAEFKADGGIVWQRDYDLGGSETFLDVALAPNAEIWTAGDVHLADHDIWVGHFGPTGELLDGEDLGSGVGDDYAGGVSIDVSGRVTVSGMLANGVGADLWVRRYSAEGNPLWTITHDPDLKGFYPFSAKVVARGDGSAVIGFRERAADNTGPEFIFEVPQDGGAPAWEKQLSGTDGTVQGIALAQNGDIVVSVSTLIEGALTLAVRRLDPAASPLWTNIACTGTNGRDVAIDPVDGSIVVIGDGEAVNSNVRLCKLTPDGELLWGQDVDGGTGDDYGRGVAITPERVIIAVGIVDAPGGTDAWVAAFTP